MSLEELSRVKVTSVSKSSQLLSAAPASIYVITREEIFRSGVLSIPEALRLAPNLQVTQLSSSNYVVTARGFGGNPEAQNFSNKLLILIDGRSVYTPLFSGVYYDAQDVMTDDVDRIEVISGPGATLWGANAMNGVINIITRAAAATRGTLVRAAAGNYERNLSARHGGKIGEQVAYRVYGKAFERDALELTDGSSAQDDWWKAQGGFRFDWSGGEDTATLQGDLYRGIEGEFGAGDVDVDGANALARWGRSTDRSRVQAQAYFDQTERAAPPGGAAFVLRTYDLELQQSFAVGAHTIVWGAGHRISSYDIRNSESLLFVPQQRTLHLSNLFAHDTMSIGSSVKASFGIKLEKDPYSGWTPLPDIRISWSISDADLLWAAATRAIRSPTPFDVDVVEVLGGIEFLTGNAQFETEKVSAYEIGYRTQPSSAMSFSVSAFYNDYDDLRTIEPAPATFIPLRWDNLMEGNTYGLEAWASWQVAYWWRLSPGFRYLHKGLSFKEGASELLGLAQAGNDPKTQASLKSSMDLGSNLTFDTFLRYVDSLPSPATESYYELSARLGWRVSRSLDVSISGFNLLDAHHNEFAAPAGAKITRSVIAGARWQF